MALFLIRHQHDPARCPARDADVGARLLGHLSRSQAQGHGVVIRGEAVVPDEHSLFLIVEAVDERTVHAFLDPFLRAGTVAVHAASTCAEVVASGGCAPGGGAGATDGDVPAMDPGEACQRAIEEGLVVHRAHPLNCETAIPALIGGVVMPNAHFYVRNHFQIPALDASTWRLRLSGAVERALELTLRDLTNMPSEGLAVTLECAGNGRHALDPPVDGEQWQLGAVSTAEWTGVPLVEVLDRAGIRPEARELVFRGADRGTVDGHGSMAFERSLPVDTARESQAVLAYAMNGEPLPIQHGYPVRLVVPGWYGVASVKWLTDIEAVAAPFDGYFQADRYWYEREQDGATVREPVTLQRVRALIVEPTDGDSLQPGTHAVRGVAWSGAAPIARVEVSVAGGPWREARLVGDRHRHSWQWWELLIDVDGQGPTTLRARATDLAGRTQPDEPVWNRLGYGNNAVEAVTVVLE